MFDKACTDCHSSTKASPATSAPGPRRARQPRLLHELHRQSEVAACTWAPTRARCRASTSELSIVDRDALAEYLVWLRTATPARPRPRSSRADSSVGYAARMPTFEYQELLAAGHHDDTPYRKLTGDFVSTFEARGKTFLEVEPEALTLLAREAMRDIAHLLRPGPPRAAARRSSTTPRRRRTTVRRARAAQEREHRGRRRAARCARTPAPRS